MSPRLRYLVSSLLIGVMGVGLAWAGSVLAPPRLGRSTTETQQPPLGGVRAQLAAASVDGGLSAGQLLAGAAKASIEPRPEDWGGTWARSGCATLGEDFAEGAPHALDPRVRWFENSNCIYSGGFGIGPMNGLTQWDEKYGLWVRSLAVSDGADTLVMTILDGAYYFGRYNNMCSPSLKPDTPAPGDGCGFFDLSEDLGAELGIPASSFMFASTHSHASPDFIGAWGGVPRWYMNQVTDALKASVRAAVASMEPAFLEAGEEMARQFSNERRDFYRSAEEYGVAWFRLVAQGDPTPKAPLDYLCTIDCPAAEGSSTEGSDETTRSGIEAQPAQTPPGCEPSGGRPKKCPTPTPTPTVEPTPTQEPTEEPTPEPTGPTEPTLRAIATVGAFAAHPTNKGSGPTAHADFPGPFEQRVEDLWGGVGLFFQTGLGNVSSSIGGHPEGPERVEQMGFGLASLMPPLGKGRLMYDPNAPVDITVAQRFWNQPSTNTVLSAGGGSGVFDRPFEALPSSVSAGENAAKTCKSASPFSVRTAVSAAKIGDLWITGAPGEIFSNYSNTIKEKNPRGVTLPLALVNDGLGYIMQSFETDHAGRQGLGFAGVIVEYEDAYSIDACFGDAALEATLILLGAAPEGNLVALP